MRGYSLKKFTQTSQLLKFSLSAPNSVRVNKEHKSDHLALISISLTYPPTHPTRLRDQEDLSLLIFFNMSGNKTTNCPKNMYNVPRITGMLPKFTDTLIQMLSIFPGNMPRFLGQLTLIKSVFHWRSDLKIRQ